MKSIRVLVVVCGMTLLSQSLLAQMKIDYGVKGGLNYYGLNLNGNGKLAIASYNSGVGYHLGGYAQFRLTKFALQPELVFSRQGQYFTTGNNSNLKTGLSYINVPIILKYYLAGGLNLQVGPQFGLLVSSKGDIVPLSGGLQGGQILMNKDLKDYIKSTDFSIAFGAGLDLPLGLSLTVRYNMGVSDINKFTGATGTQPVDANGNVLSSSISTANTKNQVLQVSVGYRLGKLGL